MKMVIIVILIFAYGFLCGFAFGHGYGIRSFQKTLRRIRGDADALLIMKDK